MTSDAPLVSVVIPAYNACSTLDETLRSVRSQSHELLEIIVVDDGSSDDTLVVAQKHASDDSRVRIIKQDNAGVAAARNRGWRSACSDLIAFVDADDLWVPDKIERQLQALNAGGEKTGLVYSWYAVIDANSRVRIKASPTFFAGDVLDNIFEGNFIGNGSAILVRRDALVAANGFESQLRAAGAQGCEDFLFYCRVAEEYHFAVVPEYQIGYRYLPDNMSSDLPRMLRSWMLVVDEMAARHPDRAAALNRGLRNYSGWLFRRALTIRKFGYFASVLVLLSKRDPLLAAKVFARDLPRDILSVTWWKLLNLRYNGFRQPVLPFPIGDPNQCR
jgi:glycosyltransferase involved in cell wall biosynthesis